MDKPAQWNVVWMNIAKEISKKSKDPNTKVGCLLVSPDNRRLHIGYNGFPVGIIENAARWQRPEKYMRVIHAENNAILNARCDLTGWTCYVTLHPCEKCAGDIVQAGIKKVIYLSKHSDSVNYDLAESILHEGMVELIQYEGA